MITHPEDIAGLFAQAWNKNDAEAIASLFAEDAEHGYPSRQGNHYPRRSRKRKGGGL